MICRLPAALVVIALLGCCAMARADAPDESVLERAYALDAGKSGPRDAAGAARLYAEAASAGDATAHLRLGYLFETGDGVAQDYAEARAHYQAAADGGLAEGHLYLAICNLEGWGAPADRAAFVREMGAAAEAGNVTAERIMSSIYITGIGVARDDAQAVQWLDRAAKQGDAASEMALGRTAEDQQVRALMHDENLARSWYQLSAEKEYTEAMRAMARTFLTGPKQDRNWSLGQQWLELAAESGDAEAPYIAAMYEMIGFDAPARIEADAIAKLELASHRGNERATEILDLYVGGRCLDSAFRYVLRVPFEDRYVDTQLRKHPPTAPTHPPIAIKVVSPVYPYSLRVAGIEGKVVVDFVVDTTGRVQNPYAIESSHPLLAERAVRAVEQWRFYPGQRDRRRVYTHMNTPVVFRLTSEDPIGADEALLYARSLLVNQSAEVVADGADLRLARTRANLPPILGEDGQPLKNARAVILLVVDASGHPVRGHVLQSTPAVAGPSVLNVAMQAEYVPRMVGNQPEESHQVLYFNSVPRDLTDPALDY